MNVIKAVWFMADMGIQYLINIRQRVSIQ